MNRLLLIIALIPALTACFPQEHPAPPERGHAKMVPISPVQRAERPAIVQAREELLRPPQPILPSPALLATIRDGAVSSVFMSAHALSGRLSTTGLPKNTRQTQEGYWIGSMPDASHIQALGARGVHVIISGSALSTSARNTAEQLGMQIVHIPFGGSFPNHRTILEGVKDVQPYGVFIHCDHGGDRTGAILAFLLSTQHNWPTERAFLAVVHPGPNDLRRLRAILEDEGYPVSDETLNQFAGIYSAQLNGGFGGLKVRGPNYEKLVRTTIAAIREANASIY
ncbi:MAG: tyrosine-protein phosphatase [Myxococcota bacterium]|nr:tyrosine-protein phosphatase [Myxococcota bacterium]